VPPLEAPSLPYGSPTSRSQSAYPLDAAWGRTPLAQVPRQSTVTAAGAGRAIWEAIKAGTDRSLH
jgi:hypothetical protein